MVLGGDLDSSALKILDRLIPAAVPKFQLEGLSTERLPKDLMPEANAEDW